MSLANVAATSLAQGHSQDVIKKFHWAIKRVASEHGNENDTALTQEELIQLIRVWEPQRDIICLYVRWARQLRRNFNLDSIATLLCLSRQCDYTPVNFLRKVKTLSIHKNQKAAYGVSFHFDIPNRKDINRERLNKEFLGLSVTLSLLQEQVTDSPSILGKTRMRQSGPRHACAINIPLQEGNTKQHSEQSSASLTTHPNVEFHTQSSLLNRIWISINHRWLVLYLAEHLFREVNVPWSYGDALVYSFQMMAPCGPGRYEFLAPLAGYCLRFCTLESIESKRTQLREIWKDPTLFLSFGNSCLTQVPNKAQARIIVACFQDLHSNFGSTCKQISYNKDSTLVRRWIILRSYIFHFWLESVSNNSIKAIVVSGQSADVGKKKRKIDCSLPTAQDKGTSTTPIIPSPAQQTIAQVPEKPSRDRSGGLQSITSSRRLSKQHRTRSNSNDNSTTTIPTVPVDSKIGKLKNNPNPTIVTPIKDIDWTSLRLITLDELNDFVKSYLLIHRLDGVDVLSELSPIEIYSANHLHDLFHCRLTGKFSFYPKGKVGKVKLHIENEADFFLDTYAKSFHVARVESEYFHEYSEHLPSLHQIQSLCNAIVHHGKTDTKRAMGQYRVNIGNGGQNWVNGAPCQLHGLQFQKDLELDPNLNATEVLHSIGQLVEFTWLVACAFQNDALDHPLAPDPIRKQLYAAHLNEYLNMNEDVGFEDLTLVVSSLYPTIHEVAEHKDVMNDTLAGYTRTACFNMVIIDTNDDAPTILHFQVICNFRKVIGNYVLPFHKFLFLLSLSMPDITSTNGIAAYSRYMLGNPIRYQLSMTDQHFSWMIHWSIPIF